METIIGPISELEADNLQKRFTEISVSHVSLKNFLETIFHKLQKVRCRLPTFFKHVLA